MRRGSALVVAGYYKHALAEIGYVQSLSSRFAPREATLLKGRRMTEEWYDDVIAPKLREAAALCEAKGCAFVAVVEYAPEKRGSTLYTPPGCGLAMILLRVLDKCGTNLDSFFISVMRYCKREGIDTSGSMVLSDFGRRPEPHTEGGE